LAGRLIAGSLASPDLGESEIAVMKAKELDGPKG
jgi:hypothetical protein